MLRSRFLLRLLAGLAALSAGASFSGTATADATDGITARLEFERGEGGEGCLDRDGLARAVDRRWGRRVFVEGGNADILLRGTIGKTKTGAFRAFVELRRLDGTSLGSRELVTASPDCSALDDSLALAVGLMLDVSRRRVAEERASTAPAASTEPVVAGPKIAIPEETEAPRAPVFVEPFAGVETDLAFLPGISFAPRVGVAIEPRRFVRIEAAGSLFLSNDSHVDDTRGARFSAWSAELAVCPLSLRGEKSALHACLSERFGQVRAAGFGFWKSTTALEPISLVGLGGVFTTSLVSGLLLRVGLRLEVPLVRYRFVLMEEAGDTHTVYSMSSIVPSAELGLAYRW